MGTSGFSLVRNATKLNYPLEESIRSLAPLCDEIIINCGDSEDDTWARLLALQASLPDKIQLLPTVWSRERQSGGYQLKIQSDAALSRCCGDWCLYIQADEVFHEADLPALRKAMEKASQRSEIDGLVFDYLHFYGSYQYTIRGRNWYRKEVRAFKNHRGISAFRDAQGFRKGEKRLTVIPSGARVFHYGYVRNASSLKNKTEEMAQWWGNTPDTADERLKWVRHVGLERFTAPHPHSMKERMARDQTGFDPTKCKRRWNGDEIKNLLTLFWETIFHYRIGEYRNYEILR